MANSVPNGQRYFLGIDTGATKSHALIADESGQAVGFGQGGPGNHEIIGWNGLKNVLHAITDQALAVADISVAQIAGAGFGLAGYDWPEDREPTVQVIESLALEAPFELVNDGTLGLLAGTAEGWGVVVAAGTSNNSRGRDRQGRAGRITGQGPRFAEYGGASELVAKALQAVSLAWSQRGPGTSLTKAFIKHTGATDVVDLLAGLTRKRYRLSAKQAPLVFQVAAGGDQVAQDIILWAGRELGGLANGVIRQLGLADQAFEVVLSGSFYNGGSDLIKAMQKTILAVAPKAKLVRLQGPPVIGGVLLAMEQVNLKTAPLRQTLIDSAKDLLS
jgi:N-acetylglucosamine kinase-like BadF-type ATPase